MKSHLLDETTGVEHLKELDVNDIVLPGTPAFRDGQTPLAMERARREMANAQQNIGRASATRTGWTTTIPFNTWVHAHFITYDGLPSRLRIFQNEYCTPIFLDGPAFRNQEAGWYNLKGAISVQISVPAVPFTKITKAECALIYSPADRSSYTWLWQHTAFADVRVVPGIPETTDQLYMPGWTHAFADKLWMDVGDCVWLVHKFTGIGDINFIEVYESKLAIQRTGEPFLEENCCGS